MRLLTTYSAFLQNNCFKIAVDRNTVEKITAHILKNLVIIKEQFQILKTD